MTRWTTFADLGVKRIREMGLNTHEAIEYLVNKLSVKYKHDRRLIKMEIALAQTWYNDASNHVFINREMSEFLISSVRDVSNCDYMRFHPLEKLMERYIFWECAIKSGLFIHLSAENYAPHDSIGIAMFGGGNDSEPSYAIKTTAFMRAAGAGVLSVAAYGSNEHLAHAKLNADQIAMCKITMGLSLYLDAFPDALREFRAPDYKEWRRSKTLTLRVPKEVQEDINHSVSPHYRRGHMRLLTSERYTEEKRGKAVFVKGCFVKGKAYEVVG